MRARLVRYVFKYFRWMLVSFLFKKFMRKKAESSLESKSRNIDNTLSPVAKAVVSSVPPRMQKTAGSALITAKSVKKVAHSTAKSAGFAKKNMRKISQSRSSLRSMGSRIKSEIRESKKQFKTEYLSATEGNEAATNSLLDVKSVSSSPHDAEASSEAKVQSIPSPVRQGRRKARPSRASQVSRVKRNYRKKRNPWE